MYYIHYDDETSLNLMQDFLSKNYNITTEDYSSVGIEITDASMEINLIMFGSIFLLIILFTILLIFDLVNQSKKLGVKKLHGYTVSSLSYEYLKDVLIIYVPIFIIISIISIFIAGFNIKFLGMMLALHLLIILVVAISIYLVTRFIYKKISLSDLLKSIKLGSITFSINSLVKILTVMSVIITIDLSINQIKDNKEVLNRYRTFSDYENLLVIKDFDMGEDLDAFSGGELLEKGQLELYRVLDKNEAVIYSNFEIYRCLIVDESCYKGDYLHALVDVNYIDQYGLLNNDELSEIKNGDDLAVVLPKSHLGDEVAIVKELSENNGTNKIEKVYYYNSAELPTLNPEIAEDTNYLIKDPIFLVFNQKSAHFLEGRIQSFGIGVNTPTKIMNSSDNIDFINQYQSDLDRLSLSDNITSQNIISIKDIFLNEINSATRLIYIFMGILGVAIILNLFVTIQNVNLYLLDNS